MKKNMCLYLQRYYVKNGLYMSYVIKVIPSKKSTDLSDVIEGWECEIEKSIFGKQKVKGQSALIHF